MYSGNNKTALASQKQIMDALLKLLEDKNFSEIKISELCKAAEISRQTFYTLYESKENVVKDLISSYRYDPEVPFAEEHEKCCHHTDTSRVCTGFGQYLYNHRELMRTLSDNGILYLLYQSLYSSIISCNFFLPDEQEREREYAANFVAGAFTGITKAYVSCGTEDVPEYLEQEIRLLFRGRYLDKE